MSYMKSAQIIQKVGQFHLSDLNPNAYHGHMVIGEKEAGKSALGEAMAIEMYRQGVVVFDAIDANDGESLFYAVPRHKQTICYPTLLVHPSTYDIEIPTNFGHIRPMRSSEGLLKILQTAKKEHRIITMACMLWPMGTVGKVLADWFFEFPKVQRVFKHHIFLFMREIGHYAFSQLRVFKEVEDRFRAAATYIMKEGRHHRITFFFDLQRAVDLYKGIRTLCDHIHIKRSGRSMIPSELEWVLKTIEDNREDVKAKFQGNTFFKLFPRIQRLWKREYYSLGRAEEVAPVRRFRMAPFRHKTPTDDFTDITGVQFIRNEVPEESETLSAEEYEVLLSSKLRREGVSLAAIARASPLDTPYNTLQGRVRIYDRRGRVVIRPSRT